MSHELEFQKILVDAIRQAIPDSENLDEIARRIQENSLLAVYFREERNKERQKEVVYEKQIDFLTLRLSELSEELTKTQHQLVDAKSENRNLNDENIRLGMAEIKRS